MIDRSNIGHEFPSFTTTVEKGRLKFFAKATGQKNVVYIDEAEAKSAGYGNLPAPPTYPFVLDMDAPQPMPYIDFLSLDMNRILHGTQEFEYFAPIESGDEITVNSKIGDIYDKKGGKLEFIVIENTYINQRGERVAKASSTIVYRNA